MPNYTSQLNLYEYDPVTDANLTFSITNALNNNWNKIDTDCYSQWDNISKLWDECTAIWSSVNTNVSYIQSLSARPYISYSVYSYSSYLTLSNGLLICWGSLETTSNGTVLCTLPIAMNSIISAYVSRISRNETITQNNAAITFEGTSAIFITSGSSIQEWMSWLVIGT